MGGDDADEQVTPQKNLSGSQQSEKNSRSGSRYRGRFPASHYLSVFENGKNDALAPEVIKRAKQKLGRPYSPGKNLKFFYTSACYGGTCETGIRQGLDLSPSVIYHAPAHTSEIRTDGVARSLGEYGVTSKWIDSQPDIRGKFDPNTLETRYDAHQAELRLKRASRVSKMLEDLEIRFSP